MAVTYEKKRKALNKAGTSGVARGATSGATTGAAAKVTKMPLKTAKTSGTGKLMKKAIQRKPVTPSKGELNRGQGTGKLMMKKRKKLYE